MQNISAFDEQLKNKIQDKEPWRLLKAVQLWV